MIVFKVINISICNIIVQLLTKKLTPTLKGRCYCAVKCLGIEIRKLGQDRKCELGRNKRVASKEEIGKPSVPQKGTLKVLLLIKFRKTLPK